MTLLQSLQDWSRKAKREGDFATRLEGLAEPFAKSAALAEFCAAAYAALNRESGYFGALVRLFDIYIEAGRCGARRGGAGQTGGDRSLRFRQPEAADAARRLPAMQALVNRIRSRLAQIATHSLQQPAAARKAGDAQAGAPPEQQTLEDLMVQAEIFLQYSLQTKTVEKLQEIAALFPGEEDRNARLRNLYQTGRLVAGRQGAGSRRAESAGSARGCRGFRRTRCATWRRYRRSANRCTGSRRRAPSLPRRSRK